MITNIIILIDIYHLLAAYLSIINVVYSILNVKELTEAYS